MSDLDTWCHCGHRIADHTSRGYCSGCSGGRLCGCFTIRPGGEPYQPFGWQPPVPVGDERLGCAYCDWSCPARYQNATGGKIEGGRDGNTRLSAHVDKEHREQHRKAKAAARSRARYARRKAAAAPAEPQGEPDAS